MTSALTFLFNHSIVIIVTTRIILKYLKNKYHVSIYIDMYETRIDLVFMIDTIPYLKRQIMLNKRLMIKASILFLYLFSFFFSRFISLMKSKREYEMKRSINFIFLQKNKNTRLKRK